MFRRPLSQIIMAVLGVAITGGFTAALAQVGMGPASDVGGYAGTRLNSLYRQGVGTGYSIGSLNQIALRNAQAQVPNVGQSGYRSSRAPNIGLGSSPASKPFSSYSPAPTTSPYLNLFREDLDGSSDLNYNTLVRPMLQQQRFNERVQRESMELSRRLQSIAAQPAFDPQGSQTQYPTGHQTVFNHLSHFYPSSARPRR